MKPSTFGEALTQLKQGRRLARLGWNGKDMFIYLVAGSKFAVNRAPLNEFYVQGTEVEYLPHIDMKYADGTLGVWVPSQTDVLAEDWVIVEPTTTNAVQG